MMSLLLFNIFFNGVGKQVNERAKGWVVKLRDENRKGGNLNKYYMQMTQCWWQKQESISNIVLMVKKDQI